MRCLECNIPLAAPSLVLAMEQREHFALQRHAEMCPRCALKLWEFLEKRNQNTPNWKQSINCAYCGHRLPVVRLRFEVGDRLHKHMAICETCYDVMRSELLGSTSNVVTFVEKEWQTPGHSGSTGRIPLPNGTAVRVKNHIPKFGGTRGFVKSYRGLIQPWFGYDIQLEGGGHHFFHERDLDILVREATNAHE